MFDASNPHIQVDHVGYAPIDPVTYETGLRIVAEQHETNDNPAANDRVGERRMFELPSTIWIGMIACYAAFLAALLAATGTGRAGFAIAVSAIYVVMFFGTALTVTRQSQCRDASPLERRDTYLQTAFGPMSRGAVFGQVLIVPVAVALFGFAVAVVIAVVM